MSDENNDDKQHQPTAKKLEDARKKGEVPRSQEINVAAVYGGFLIACLMSGAWMMEGLNTQLQLFFGMPLWVQTGPLDGAGGALIKQTLTGLATSVAAIFLLPILFVFLAVIGTRSFVVSADKIKPKLSKISPLSNAKQKFGRSGLFEFAKSAIKLLIISVLLWGFVAAHLEQIVNTVLLSPMMISAYFVDLVIAFLLLVTLIALSIGGVDYAWQYAEHMRKNMMSHKELMDETKESEGDPYLKNERRQRGYDIAMNQMLADVPTADVIVVNPTHYAVALKWDRASGRAPICVAKGVDEIAAKIRAIANENAVPIHSDPKTARALYAQVDIGDEIEQDHYRAVAAAIRFAEKLRAKMRTGSA
ncbi:flagellar biosynthesis protein FlhB [Nereida sp. MMG025]|uniref:EscU/YscU/HrcU family type III secretion system export apparatus switch protein n=1 Tax=Nereida sp. MMG025 TaxID=2909981 RepID=UPI001F31D11B|nr:flagellar type III secretion system protein FlhB [Nereida sp. MMG025]MCF6444675.1 flagellar type III secretion system protein FlhB [Nereida sp. MMG025]